MASPKIRKVTARPVLAPLTRPITTATVVIPKAPLVLIDIETDQGIIGRSYIFTYTPMALGPAVQLIEAIGENIVGKGVVPKARMTEMEQSFRLLGRQGLVAMALAGLDMALWDALAKSHDMPVASLLGAGCDPIPCYDSHGVIVLGRDENLIAHSLKAGFKAIKFKVGAGSLEEDVETIRAVREHVGRDVQLMVDYNQSLTVTEAIRRIRRFEDEGLDLAWVEEPVGAENFEGHQAVRSQVKTAIQTGENWWMPDDAARAIDAKISDHAMLDIMKIGGLTGWQLAAAYAQRSALEVSSHIFIEASAHALANTSNAFLLEHLDVAGALLRDPYEIGNGTLAPQGPGLGIEWNEKEVQKNLAS